MYALLAPMTARAQGLAPQVRVILQPANAAAGDTITIFADVTVAPDIPRQDALAEDILVTMDPAAIGINKFVTPLDSMFPLPGICAAGHVCRGKTSVVTDVYTTPGPHTITVTATDSKGRTGTGSAIITITPAVDNDGDGLPDAWENRYALNANSASGNDGASGDPDGDGVTNIEEFRAHTNPVARYARVFAEGSYGDRQLLVNCFVMTQADPFASQQVQRVRVLAIGDNGRTDEQIFTFFESYELCPLGGQNGSPFSGTRFVADRVVAVSVESIDPLVVERVTKTLRSVNAFPTTARNTSLGVQSPSRTWYFARGAAGRGIDLFFLAFNPGTQPVEATFAVSGGPNDPPAQITRTLPPGVRTTVWINQDLPAAAAYDGATTITATGGIYVERAWRYQAPGRTVPFDSVSRGASVASPTWYFAAGALSERFDTSFAIMNPSDSPTSVAAQFLRSDAAPVSRTISLPPHSRSILKPRDLGIGGASVALTLSATDGIGIVAERTTDGVTSSGPWRQSNLGATEFGTTWMLATINPDDFSATDQREVIIANLSDVPGRVRLRGGIWSWSPNQVIDLPAQRVVTMPIPADAVDWAMITSEPTSTGGRAPAIVVERATYATIDDTPRARQVTVVGNVIR